MFCMKAHASEQALQLNAAYFSSSEAVNDLGVSNSVLE